MLALTKNNVFVKEVYENSRLEVDGIVSMPAMGGWVFQHQENVSEDPEMPQYHGVGPVYELHKIVEAETPPEGFYVVSSSVVFKDNSWTRVNVLAEIIPPTAEELRSQMPALAATEFRKKLRRLQVVERSYVDEGGETKTYLDGIYEEDILEKIALISDKELAAEAKDYFLYAQYFERINPWVDFLGYFFGLSPERIDEEWVKPM